MIQYLSNFIMYTLLRTVHQEIVTSCPIFHYQILYKKEKLVFPPCRMKHMFLK